MIKNATAIIPARAGSLRLKNKNRALLWGDPLVVWTIRACLNAHYVDKIVVASDDNIILSMAAAFQVITHRRHAVDDHESKITACRSIALANVEADSPLVIVQANSPDIHYEDIDEAIKNVQRGDRLECFSVDNNLEQIGALRAYRHPMHLFTPHLSYKSKVIQIDCSDIHTQEDIDVLEKRGKPDHMR